MRVGITLPQFRHEAGTAVAVARRAEEAGLDGVFAFDHLWPLGQPDRPALHGTSLLAALTGETREIGLGTLVARVGLLPDEVLVRSLVNLDRMAEGRFVAGLGTGDRASAREHLAAGLDYPPARQRVAALGACAQALRGAGVRTWVGGHSAAVRRLAADVADGWNGWGQPVEGFGRAADDVRDGLSRPFEVSWGGQVLVGETPEEAEAKLSRHGDRPGLVHGTVADLARHLGALAASGAAWAVCAPLDVGVDAAAVDLVGEAAALWRGGAERLGP